MKRICLLSDTHGWLDPAVEQQAAECDEIWHAGDLGSLEVGERLAAWRPLRAVHGNIDGPELRRLYPLDLRFELEGVRVFMTHIGGRPGRYDKRVRGQESCDLFVCGHSHILRVERDPRAGWIYLNPGAAGHEGEHLERTLLLFTLEDRAVREAAVVRLGPRGTAPSPRNSVV